MTIQVHNMEGFPPPPPGASHVSVATGNQLIHVAGQTGTDKAGAVLDGLAAQTDQAFRNIASALDEAGATPADLVKLTAYVVDWDMSKLEELITGGREARTDLSFPDVPITLIGVTSLFTPDMLVEIEAVAVLES